MINQIISQNFDEERALYNLKDTAVVSCTFAGPADGESVLKEARNITVDNCSFSLRYPMWHVRGFHMADSTMDEATRAAIWYAVDGQISKSRLEGIKAVRECSNISLSQCHVVSQEFGWKSDGITLLDTEIVSEYLFLDSRNITLDHVRMSGKYSFQYVDNLHIKNSRLDTKDAFWHAKNVTVENSEVKGEYLGWFSEGLTLINCTISGTQPLCYSKNLKLINCTMEGADLAFEYSDVEADIRGHVISVKNPRSGHIVADSIGEIVREDPIMECTGMVTVR